jgi:hypothetical protein
MTPTNDWPDEKTLIPDLLETAPQARSVLDRYGLRGCGGLKGPHESLGFFARAHEVPLEPLIAEVRQACRAAQPARLEILDQAQPQAADAIYRPFFKAGILVVLSLGAVWGAWLLLQIARTGEFAAASLHDVNAHGHAQIFGWVGLFVMGFAYQAFPRFKHATLAWPRLAFATLWMMLLGLVVRSVAQPLADQWTWTYWPAVGASVLEIVAIGLFVAIILRTWRISDAGLVFYEAYIASALGWFFVQGVYESVFLAATLSARGEELVRLVGTWQPALRDIQIHGFALMMILGVSQRIFHHFYGMKQPDPRLSLGMLGVLNAAVVGEVAGLILMQTAGIGWAKLWYASALALTFAVIVLVWSWRIFAHCDEADRSLKFLRTGYVWLLVSLGMLVALPAYQFGLLPRLAAGSSAVEMGFSHAYYGAIRHAITVGFVSMMIVGVAAKVVPTLNGIPTQRLSPLWGPFLLINCGCALRVVGQTATDFTGAAFPVTGVSGLLEVTGLALWGGHLWLIMAGRARLRAEQGATEPAEPLLDGVPLGPKHTVGAVVERYPELLDVFLRFGFTMLANPQLRRTIARVVTIERACRRMDVDLAEFLEALNRQRQRARGALPVLEPAARSPCAGNPAANCESSPGQFESRGLPGFSNTSGT